MWRGFADDSVFNTIDVYSTMKRAQEELVLLRSEINLAVKHILAEIRRIEGRIRCNNDDMPKPILHNWQYMLKRMILDVVNVDDAVFLGPEEIANNVVDEIDHLGNGDEMLEEGDGLYDNQDMAPLADEYDMDDEFELNEDNDWILYDIEEVD
jgi:hypothetical protein